MEKTKNERAQRIETLAAIAFGRDPETGTAQRGWQARLARAIGVSRAAISDTLPLANSGPMDRKLAAYCLELRLQMLRDIERLAELRMQFISGKENDK